MYVRQTVIAFSRGFPYARDVLRLNAGYSCFLFSKTAYFNSIIPALPYCPIQGETDTKWDAE